jgi:hypothetical protein
MLKHCAANRKRWLSTLPNVGPYINDVKISLQGTPYIYDISRFRVKTIGTIKVVRLSVIRTGRLYPQETFLVLISVRG